jgi:hypothetical protein
MYTGEAHSKKPRKNLGSGVRSEGYFLSFSIARSPASLMSLIFLLVPRDTIKSLGKVDLSPAMSRQFANLTEFTVIRVLLESAINVRFRRGISGGSRR